MKMILDVETTGLPNVYTDLNTYKNVIQISYIIINDDNKEIGRSDFIIKQDSPIPESSTKIHGITDEKAKKYGIDFLDAWAIVEQSMKICSTLIGHNISFDINSIKADLIRRGKKEPTILLSKIVDTMKAAEGLNHFFFDNGDPRWPKLTELYKFLFEEEMENAHNSLYDVIATKKCFIELDKRGLIKE